MPSGMGKEMREFVELLCSRTDIEPKTSPYSQTGFVNVIKVGKWYQARLQVPGDGRGGEKKRKQYSLPGIFEEAEDAALYLAAMIKDMKEANGGALVVPPKQDKEHRARTPKAPAQPAAAAPPLPQPLPTAAATPIPMPMFNLPFVAVSPLPMQPLAYFPPRF